MNRNLFCLGCGLIALALAAGCQATGSGAADDKEKSMPDRRSAREILAEVLQKSGMTETDLVLHTVFTLPPPLVESNDYPRVAWQGCFAGQPQALVHSNGQMLVVVSTIDRESYLFNPYNRTWTIGPGHSDAGGSQLWVLFYGKAADFVTEVIQARDAHEMLRLQVRPSRPVTAPVFPARISSEEMQNDLLELSLHGLEEQLQHLRLMRSNGQPCNPEVNVYYKPSMGK